MVVHAPHVALAQRLPGVEREGPQEDVGHGPPLDGFGDDDEVPPLRIDHRVMVGVCDSLEQAGDVRRERDAGDRRAYAVTITDSGRRLLNRVEKAIPGFLDDTFRDLTAGEREQLSGLLGKLLRLHV